MDKLLSFLQVKPKLYEKTQYNIWDNDYVSKGMLQAHLDESLDSASRNIKFVNKSVNWISELFPPTKYHNLLDLGCGPGIYTERFYNRGYYVTGIDISKRSIMYAKQSAMKNNMNIDYILNSYIEYEFQKTFDLVTLIYCDYGVLSPQERHTLLKKVYHVLSQQGVSYLMFLLQLNIMVVKKSVVGRHKTMDFGVVLLISFSIPFIVIVSRILT